MRKFLEAVSDYTITPLNLILRLCTRVPDLNKPSVTQKVFSLVSNHSDFKKTPQRDRLISALSKTNKNKLTIKEKSKFTITHFIFKCLNHFFC